MSITGKIIKWILINKNMKVKELAKHLHKSEQAVYENFKRDNIPLSELRQIVTFLSMSDEDIVKVVRG